MIQVVRLKHDATFIFDKLKHDLCTHIELRHDTTFIFL